MTTYQDDPPQTFPLNIPNNSIENVLGYYVKVTDTGTTIINRKYKKDGVIIDAFIGEIPKKGNYKPTSVSSTEETQYFSGTLNATNLIRNQAIPVVNRGIGGVAGGGNNKINSILGTNLASSSASDPPLASNPPPNFNLEISQETKKVEITTTPSILRYPLNYDSKNNNYDYLKIQVAKYVPGLSGGLQEGTIPTIQSVKTRITEKGTSVILPMYPGISESNSVDWGSDQLNPIQATFGAAAFNTIQGFATNPKGFAGALQNAGDQMSAAVRSLITNNPDLQTFISAYFAGQAVGANILGRTTGMVVNPNLELLFKGPQLRSFKYSYRFTPRDNKEAKEIRRIIKFFKREMAVQKSANNVFLKTPNVFFLDYIFKGNETNIHPFLNKIKPCALTSFNVNYTPDGTYMTYHDGEGIANGSMTSYSVDMQFDELEPIYRDDHSDSLDDPTMGY